LQTIDNRTPVLVALPIRDDDVVKVAHDGLGGGVGESDGSNVVGLAEAVARGELMEATAVNADDHPGIGEDGVGLLECTHVLISGSERIIFTSVYVDIH